MTNTETCMREMRYIASLFDRSQNFDEQWVLFKAYLNTIHSLSDNDSTAKSAFRSNDLMNFVLVLRNILHHQPAKWHFGKHDVFPTELSFNWSQNEAANFAANLSLVVPKVSLENPDLQQKLESKSPRQLNILKDTLKKTASHVFVVSNVIQQVQEFVEAYCKINGHYTDSFDKEPLGYRIIKDT